MFDVFTIMYTFACACPRSEGGKSKISWSLEQLRYYDPKTPILNKIKIHTHTQRKCD